MCNTHNPLNLRITFGPVPTKHMYMQATLLKTVFIYFVITILTILGSCVYQDSTHGMHKTASDGEVKLDDSLTQHCLEKRALNVDDDDDDEY